jgi:hypothetical protein
MVTLSDCVDVRIIQGLDSGKTYGITLPKYWMREYGLKKGDRVKLTKQKDYIIIEKLEL